MRSILAVAYRDLRAAFFSPLAYGLLSMFICVAGFFFFNLLGSFNFAIAQEAQLPVGDLGRTLNLNEWVVQGYFQTILLLLILIVPLITMRAFSEERQNGMFLLLESLPVSAGSIFTGKVVASLTLVLAMLLLSFLLPLSLCFVSTPELWPILTGMLGLIFAALAFVTIGISVSALCQNVLLSGILTLGIFLLLYGIHVPSESFGELGQGILRALSPLWQLRELFRGVITLAPLAYFLSLSILATAIGVCAVFPATRR